MKSSVLRSRVLIKTVVALLGLATFCSACRSTSPVEHGVVFSKIPPILGGGISDKVIAPGKTTWLWPWEDIYMLDTSIQSLTWGEDSHGATNDDIQTRTLDGNEIGLVMTVQYHLSPEKLPYIIQKVGTTNERIRDIVATIARSDIRTHMNILRNHDYVSTADAKLNRAIELTKKALVMRLEPEGIIIDNVIYKNRRFERDLPDGTEDRRYQEQLEKTQATYQEAEQEKKRIKAAEEQKKREYNDAEAIVFRQIEEAKGYERQAQLRGDAYLAVKQNEAAQVEAAGNAEIEGLKKQVAAFSGAGGKSLLRLDIINSLAASKPKFVLLNNQPAGQCGGVTVNKVDSNDFARQLGIFSVAVEPTEPKPSK